jgi:hypothetical protein
MYRNCIFCSGELGQNESIEGFPVGRQLAFDAWEGRLWAICPACGRWNLAPIEERWEAVEMAEKLFRDARLRVQSENVGLAKLLDGTRLVRVGKALPGELAAWRYGSQLLNRRKRHLILTGAGTVAAVSAWSGLSALGVSFIGIWIGNSWVSSHLQQRIVYRLSPLDDPAGDGVTIRRWHVPGLRLLANPGSDDIQLEVRDSGREKPESRWDGVDPKSNDLLVLSGAPARTALARAMIRVNKAGATREKLRAADRLLAEAGSAERLLRDTALGGAALGDKAGRKPEVLKGSGALALEMALHEQNERRALEGELSALEAAWREAEEIAAIADKLPGEETLNQLLDRLTRQ